MQLHTWAFAIFFLAFYAGHLALRRTPLRTIWLLAASYAFYATWSPRYPLLIAYATMFDYLVVLAMARTPWKRPWLVLSVVNNLALLGYYKYSDFLAENFSWLLAQFGVPYRLSGAGLLPVGISFFVFRSLTYTIDAFRGNVAPERNLLRYASFVAFFPELLMGPIDRAADLLPQLRQAPRVAAGDVADGMSLILLGLFKKIALADYLGLYVDSIYASPGEHAAPALLAATVAFAWQIYFDFSGYCDIARGIGRLLGLRLALNFNHPYLADGLGDFWRRWHITLSNWFKDYVYVPLGGNRRGALRTYVNMFLTMVLSGLWHGPTWNFVIWGAVHALGRVLTRALEATPFYRRYVPAPCKQLATFALVCFAWIFFRAATLGDALVVVRGIAVFDPLRWSDPRCPLLIVLIIAGAWLYQWTCESRFRWLLQLAAVRVALAVLMILYLATFAGSGTQGFIYEQF